MLNASPFNAEAMRKARSEEFVEMLCGRLSIIRPAWAWVREMQTRVYKAREIFFNKRNESLLVRPTEFKAGQCLNRRAEKIDGAEPNVRAVVVSVQQGPECCSEHQVVAVSQPRHSSSKGEFPERVCISPWKSCE